MSLDVRRLVPDGSLVVFRDVTVCAGGWRTDSRDRRRMKSFGYMAGGIAHDFNNLLLPILCCSGILQAESGSSIRSSR